MNRISSGALVCALAAASFALAAACSNEGTSCGDGGGPVIGPPDDHCTAPDGGAIVQTVDPAACHPDAGPDGGSTTDYGPTLDNSEADDDDCKYHVKWTSTAVCENTGVVFTVTATNETDGSPLAGADMEAEVFLSLTHTSSTPYVFSTETAPGTYVTDPVQFDMPGDWTVRFHFHEECEDLTEDSPHGHAAFYVHVP
jgi:hypothetical protein